MLVRAAQQQAACGSVLQRSAGYVHAARRLPPCTAAHLLRPSTSRPNQRQLDGACQNTAAHGPRTRDSTAATLPPLSALNKTAPSFSVVETGTPPNTSPAVPPHASQGWRRAKPPDAPAARTVEAQQAAIVAALDGGAWRVSAQLQQRAAQRQLRAARHTHRRVLGAVRPALRQRSLDARSVEQRRGTVVHGRASALRRRRNARAVHRRAAGDSGNDAAHATRAASSEVARRFAPSGTG
jgi:hypothetical protein